MHYRWRTLVGDDAEDRSTDVSPGWRRHRLSSPLQTQVSGLRASREKGRLPRLRIMPASSDTGMNAPERPPTLDDAMTPPFFTASLSMASAAAVPGPPHFPRRWFPESRDRVTLGRRRRERQIEDPFIHAQAFARLARHELACARDLEDGRLIASEMAVMSASFGMLASTERTTPARNAHVHDGVVHPHPSHGTRPLRRGCLHGIAEKQLVYLRRCTGGSAVASGGLLHNAPRHLEGGVRNDARASTPRLLLEHTKSVAARASGMESMRLLSARDAPLCTRAEKPPTKSTPTTFAALSMATAMGDRSRASVAAQISAMGVTEMRLFTMGMPYSHSGCSAVGTSCSAAVVHAIVDLARAIVSMSKEIGASSQVQSERNRSDVEVPVSPSPGFRRFRQV